jgi:hypothetical protein
MKRVHEEEENYYVSVKGKFPLWIGGYSLGF